MVIKKNIRLFLYIKDVNMNIVYASLFDHVEMIGLIGAGNNPRLSMTVAVAVAVQEAMNK